MDGSYVLETIRFLLKTGENAHQMTTLQKVINETVKPIVNELG